MLASTWRVAARSYWRPMNHKLIFLFIILTSCSHSREYKIKFDEVERLEAGEKIFIRGVYVGEVIGLEEKDKNVLVTISITKDIKVTEGSKFVLQSDLFGSQHIEIELANTNHRLIEPGQLQTGEIRPMDTTRLRKLTQEEYDSMLQANPGARLGDSLLKILRTVYKDKKKSDE
jgi:phospholipid/cholesterol/gamma-HCH transport system substrate-binding protein